MKVNKTIEYQGKTYYIIKETEEFYFVSESLEGTKQFVIHKPKQR